MNKKIICIFIVLILILTIKPISLAANEVRMETIQSEIAWIGDMVILIDDNKKLIVVHDDLHDASARWKQSGFEIIGYVGVNITFIKGNPSGLIDRSIMGGELWLNYVKLFRYAIGPGVIFAILTKNDRQIRSAINEFKILTSILDDDDIDNGEFELEAGVKAFGTLGIRIFRPKWSSTTPAVTLYISYD